MGKNIHVCVKLTDYIKYVRGTLPLQLKYTKLTIHILLSFIYKVCIVTAFTIRVKYREWYCCMAVGSTRETWWHCVSGSIFVQSLYLESGVQTRSLEFESGVWNLDLKSEVWTLGQIFRQVFNFVVFQQKKMSITMNFSQNKPFQVTHFLCIFRQLSFT